MVASQELSAQIEELDDLAAPGWFSWTWFGVGAVAGTTFGGGLVAGLAAAGVITIT